jgi:hypothetical protein
MNAGHAKYAKVCKYFVCACRARSTKHEAPSTKHQAPSTKSLSSHEFSTASTHSPLSSTDWVQTFRRQPMHAHCMYDVCSPPLLVSICLRKTLNRLAGEETLVLRMFMGTRQQATTRTTSILLHELFRGETSMLHMNDAPLGHCARGADSGCMIEGTSRRDK